MVAMAMLACALKGMDVACADSDGDFGEEYGQWKPKRSFYTTKRLRLMHGELNDEDKVCSCAWHEVCATVVAEQHKQPPVCYVDTAIPRVWHSVGVARASSGLLTS